MYDHGYSYLYNYVIVKTCVADVAVAIAVLSCIFIADVIGTTLIFTLL